jgi:hypothetical protein
MSPRRNWDSPNPSLTSEFAHPPRTGGRGAHSPAGEGLGESQFRRLKKKLSTLPTLYVFSTAQQVQPLLYMVDSNLGRVIKTTDGRTNVCVGRLAYSGSLHFLYIHRESTLM